MHTSNLLEFVELDVTILVIPGLDSSSAIGIDGALEIVCDLESMELDVAILVIPGLGSSSVIGLDGALEIVCDVSLARLPKSSGLSATIHSFKKAFVQAAAEAAAYPCHFLFL